MSECLRAYIATSGLGNGGVAIAWLEKRGTGALRGREIARRTA